MLDESNYPLYGKYWLAPYNKRVQLIRTSTSTYLAASPRLSYFLSASYPRALLTEFLTKKQSEMSEVGCALRQQIEEWDRKKRGPFSKRCLHGQTARYL
jgi:hypothetical protein